MKINCSHTEVVDLDTLVPNPRNPNTHPKKQIELLAKIMKHQGWRSPIIVSNRSGFIVKGHGRLEAARLLGWDKAPIDKQDYANEADEWADLIADNKIAELAESDDLKIQEIALDLGPDFDFDLLGVPDFQVIGVDTLPPGDEDAIPEKVEPKSKRGDTYKLGIHRLMCGDSTSIDDVETLMAGEKVAMVFTDPPYGIDVVSPSTASDGGSKAFGTVGAKNGTCSRIIKANEYMQIKGDDTTKTAIDSYNLCAALEIPIMCFWGANYYASALPDRKKWIFWDKETTGDFSDGELAWTNLEGRVQRFKHVWNGLIKESEKRDKRVHPTQKPIALAEWCFQELDPKGKTVLDLFGGSGSTLIACEKTNRSCFMMEIEPHYCDVIVARWENYTGKKAELING